ncbi:putative B3 domain-containing protein Os03g0621600 isoform X2 [Gossypium arboreum]|uniref:putative B3 domain-containing protein Os03g0621600 isoform X2 n=1 Tax=Gossypium arboreum TaxID=29729 RepID=UPI0022F16E7D|nr:putative B3 domain-containing protein Os03g0621600 isoform X2 [Gossypium arboreum]
MIEHTLQQASTMFTSKTPHFFKVILQETLRDGILGIPRKFVRKYGNQLSSPVKLEVPSGAIWQVELAKTDERVRLQNGWREFAEHYSLELGSFVVFRYEGNDHFHVLIFDKSASETEYPHTSTEAQRSIGNTDGTRSLVSDTNSSSQERCPSGSTELKDSKFQKRKKRVDSQYSKKDLRDEFICSAKHDNGGVSGACGCLKPDLIGRTQPLAPTEKQRAADIVSWSSSRLVSRKSKEKSHLPCPLPQKKMRIDSSNQHGQNSKLKVLSSGTSPDAQRTVKTKAFSCVQRLAAIEKAHAVQIASAFESTENPIFMIVMQPSYVRGTCRMFIPSDFARKFLTVHKSNLTLCNSTGKTWHAKLYHPANKKPNAHLCGGWREFVEDNHLNVGDICVFELIKHPEILMKVQIYPVVKNASKASGQQALGSIVSRVKTRSLVSDAEPNCQQSPSSSSESKDLTDSHIKTLHDSPLDQKTKKKLTRSSAQPCKMTRTSLSGSIQAKGIKHEKGKSLNFQYSTEELGGGLKNSAKGDSGRKSGARRCLKPDPVYQKQRACTGGGAFRTSNPSFSVVIHPSHIGSCSTVHIPEEFGKRYLKKNGEMMLRVADGRSWNVEYERIGTNKGRKAGFGGKSWGQFAMDNELEVGDVCVFELMNENGNLLEVVIHRKLLLVEIN